MSAIARDPPRSPTHTHTATYTPHTQKDDPSASQALTVEACRQVVDLLVTQGQRFDIILMDSMMKIMDGPEAVAAVRQHEWNMQQCHQVCVCVRARATRRAPHHDVRCRRCSPCASCTCFAAVAVLLALRHALERFCSR